MKQFMLGVGAVLYVLIAVHVWNVIVAAEQRTGTRHTPATDIILSAIWPFDIAMLGTVVLMTGESLQGSLFDPNYHYKEPAE